LPAAADRAAAFFRRKSSHFQQTPGIGRDGSIDHAGRAAYLGPIVTQQSDKTRQYGQTAATLLVAYLLVLQGLAAGLVVGARAGQNVNSAICLSAKATTVDEGSQGPRAPAHRMDACCLQHCTGLDGGVLGDFAELDAPRSPEIGVLAPLRESGGHKRLAQLPVGARAPPVLSV
jgi:hypothetical protein